MFSRIYTGVSHATITIYPHVRVILNIESSLTNSRHSLHRRNRDETRVSPPTFFWRGIKPLRQPQHRASSKSRNRPTRFFFFISHLYATHTSARRALLRFDQPRVPWAPVEDRQNTGEQKCKNSNSHDITTTTDCLCRKQIYYSLR